MKRAARAALFALAVVRGAHAGTATATATFEQLARDAAPVRELDALVAPFAMDCRRQPDELARLRCETVRATLRARLPARTFVFARDDADAVLVSPYDPAAREVRVAVVGCLSCRELVDAGDGEGRFVTLEVPARGPSGGPVAAEVLRGTIALASVADAGAWLKNVRPFLRVELLFRPVDRPWAVGTSRGYAFAPVGVRVSNRCTGEVLLSQPPSQAAAPRDEPCTSSDTAP